MKHIIPAIYSIVACALTSVACAQVMPQDHWRDSGIQFSSPTSNALRAIAIGSGGVYVGESNGGSITKILQFSESGAFIRRFSASFGNIGGITCSSVGNVFVVDLGDSTVKKYDASGNFLLQWGGSGSGDGKFNFTGVTSCNMITVSLSGDVYVCDPGNSRMQVFNGTGTFMRKWGQAGSLPGQFSSGEPNVVCVSDNDRVYVNATRVFTKNGTYISGSSVSTSSIAISKDGLLATQYSPNSSYPAILDPAQSFTYRGGIPASESGVAFSAKGHVFSVSGTKVSISLREYGEAINFPNPTAIPHPFVSSSSQRAGTNLIDVDYIVNDADSTTVTTALLAVRENAPETAVGGFVAMRSFVESTATNVGASQPVGLTRHVTWNMPADWAVDYGNISIEAMAKDSRNLLGVHWITIPASGGQPAFQVSYKPVPDGMLLDLWRWFMGNGMVTTAYTNSGSSWLGTISGNSGIYTGVKLNYDVYSSYYGIINYSTAAGRLYASGQMGARPITASELQRAQAGNYGLASVDQYSLVKLAATPTSFLKGWGSGSGEVLWQAFSASNVSAIAAGGDNSFVLTADGTLWGSGGNSYGELGIGNTSYSGGLVQVATGVAQVSTSGNHTLFVKTDGSLWGMGYNSYGQLGDGTTTDRNSPVQIATGVSQASAGYMHSFFVKTDGKLMAMGYNGYGQLGDGTTTNRSSPVQIATGVSQSSAGQYHSMFVKNDGTLMAMGNNGNGQLGNGTNTQQSTPVVVTTGVSRVSCGKAYSAFVKTGGTLWSTGYNSDGQLGDGTTTQRISPVQVATGVASVAAGGVHMVFLKTDNTAWSTGNNSYGQLGDGTTTPRTTPIQFDTGVSGIAAGDLFTIDFVIP